MNDNKNKRNQIQYYNIFPQANDIYKVIKIGELIYNDTTCVENIMLNLDISVLRQYHYYFAAGKFIGIFVGKNELTQFGREIFSLDNDKQLKKICTRILDINIFYNYFLFRDKNNILELLKNKYKLNDTTAQRRISTVKKWVEWCDCIINDYGVD